MNIIHSVRFNILGEFQCLSGSDKPLEIRSSKSKAVIATLILSNGFSSTRCALINLLWSGNVGDQARGSLRHSLWSLRKLLNNESLDLLGSNRQKIFLNLEIFSADVVDFIVFSQSKDKKYLEQAVSLYRGDLLEDLSIDEEPWNRWLNLERDRMSSIFVGILIALIDHAIAASDYNRMIETGQRLVEFDPFYGEGHRALMMGYSALNQKGRAMKQFCRCKELYERELGCQPDSKTQNLYKHLKN